jgi:hypothetical protein
MTLIQELVDCIGEDAVVRLVLRLGGLRVRVPKTATPDHHLTLVVGPEAAHSLARVFGGEQIEIPQAAGWRAEMVRRRIAELSRQGLGTGAIARRLGMTQRGVQVAMRRRRTASGRAPVWRQLSLFPEDM